MNLHRTIALALLVVFSSSFLSGCVKKTPPNVQKPAAQIELVYYKLFDDEDTMQPLIQEYMAKHPGISIRYRKFADDPAYYQSVIVNGLAEGEGPDIFSVPNSWFLRNSKKISPLPNDLLSSQEFEQTFVSVASKDLVFPDPVDGEKKIFGIPLTVDTLALYYNKAHFEDALPSSGRPSSTWEQLKEDVYQLTKRDKSYEGFQVGGIAMGRSDNIARAVDVLYMLMLQHQTRFYNDTISKAVFASLQQSTPGGSALSPAAEALRLYTSFALPANKNYSWSQYMVPDPNSPVKEMETFAKGKVSMIFGYSYLYEQIKNQIQDLKEKGLTTMDPKDIRVSVVPQVNDPAFSTQKRVAYANYYAETVARTSKHPREAWEFLKFLSSKENLEKYHEKTHKPTSRRDMIDDQKQDAVYGSFAEQIGFAESVPVYDEARYQDIFSKAIEAVIVSTVAPEEAMKTAENHINLLLPPGGLVIEPTKNTKSTTDNSSSAKK